ncbi:NACHT, LRR and PYD domains-containing protein 3-like [Acanthaster planci]|uniref:NACHT, LRR and PYD domains-containing protein 3-like n=1 Tax=Acanthaster planci TaxID=133434 RepID=A0A8B8A2W3_ACAPL|nr:NACHT, LRR and PYD domains-containing protein 3-like [Acanthaster planci]
MLPWVDDDQKHIMDIYTKLQLEKDHECDLKGKVESCSDVFKLRSKDGHPINRAIFKGTPGIGKTTFFDKLAYDWAKGAAVLKQFQLVFVLKMRSLKQESNLIDALFDQLLDSTEISKVDLAAFIATRADEVLFLLDGFDEFMMDNPEEKNFGSILKTLNQKGKYKDCCAFVTTRPSHYDKLVQKCLIQRPFAHVNVMGFGDEDIKTYMERFYHDDLSKAKGLIERIRSSTVLLDLAKSPMLLLLMCLLWKENSSLPETMSRLYNESVEYIFKRKTSISTEQIPSLVTALGKIAFDGLLSLNQKLSFGEGDFNQDVLDQALAAGILTSERVLKGLHTCKNVYFIHKTFQEFCAGKYYQSLGAGEAALKFETFLRGVPFPPSFEYLLRFCCGDNHGQNASSILRILSDKVRCRGRLDIDKTLCLALNCFLESQCDELPPEQFIECVLSNDLSLQNISSDVLKSIVYFLDCVTDQAKGGGNTCLHRVLDLDVSGCHLKEYGETFARYVKEMQRLSIISFSLSTVSETQIQTCLNNKMQLTQLTIERKTDERDFTISVTDRRQYNFRRERKVRPSHLAKLNLSGNRTLGSSSPWSHLAKMQHIQAACFMGCNLTREEIPHIADALSSMQKLADLDLSNNPTLSGSGGAWLQLAKIKQVKKVAFRDCDLKGDDIVNISDALSKMPVIKLDLGYNPTLGDSGAALSHLGKVEHIEKIDFVKCNLKGDDVPHIADALSNMPKLVELGLTGNDTLGGSGSAWSHFAKIKPIQKIDWRSCRLTGDDIPHIADALSNMTNLVELNLLWNPTLGGSGGAWSHLAKIKQIQKVNLMSCNLTGDDVPYIAEALGTMPKLVELDVSSNVELGGSGEALSTMAKLKHIQKIRLRDCNVTRDDMKYIANAMSRESALVRIDLSPCLIFGGSGEAWSSLVKDKDTGRCIKIILQNSTLIGNDHEHVTETLSSTSNHAELDLTGNYTLVGSVDSYFFLTKSTNL